MTGCLAKWFKSYLQVNHSRQRGENARCKLGCVNKELWVNEEHATDVEVQWAKMIDELTHDGDVRVELYLTYSIYQHTETGHDGDVRVEFYLTYSCLLYTSDAADE